jgi:hypothetical protein
MNRHITQVLALLVLSTPLTSLADEIRIQNATYDAVGSKIIVKGVLDAIAPGTTVRLLQDSNNRELARDTDGNKQFGFQVPIAVGQAVPCVLRVEAGNQISFAQVRHSNTCGQKLLTLEGQVIDAPIPGATVTVTVNGVSYTTIADANGFYSLDIATASISELVTIEATKKQTNGETVNFVSLAGSFSKLLEDASGGVLSTQQNQKVNVTNVSTAEYQLVVAANGGSAPATTEQLQLAETKVDATQLLELAAVIKLIVDDGYALPSGYSTILQFIAQPAAVDSFIAQVNATDPNAMTNATLEILSTNGLVAGFSFDDIPARLFVTNGPEQGFLARAGDVLEFPVPRNCAGTSSSRCTGKWLSRDVSGIPVSSDMQWYIDAGVLQVVPQTPMLFDQLTSTSAFLARFPSATMVDQNGNAALAADCPDVFFAYKQKYLRASFTRFNDGQAVEALSQRIASELTNFEPIMCNGGKQQHFTGFYPETDNVSNVLARDSGSLVPLRFASSSGPAASPGDILVEGGWSMQVYSNLTLRRDFDGTISTARRIFSDLVTLSTGGTASAAISGPDGPLSWAIDSVTGELVLGYAGGWTQRITVTDSNDSDGDGDIDEYGAFSVFSGPAGERHAAFELLLRRNAALVLDQSLVGTPDGKFWQTVVNAWQQSAWEDVPGSGRRLRASQYFGFRPGTPSPPSGSPAGTGFQATQSNDPSTGCASSGDYFWFRRFLRGYQLEPGSLNRVTQRYRAGGRDRDRIWGVLESGTVGGNRRLYVLEAEQDVATEEFRFVPRPNIYIELNEPTVDRGFCASGFTPAP